MLPLLATARRLRAANVPLRLSVRVEALFPGLELEEQMRRVADAGYQGFEFGDWRAQDARSIVALKNKLGLQCVCIVGNKSVNPKGMGLCDPAEREGFLAEVRASLDAARRFDTKAMVVLTGFRADHLSREAQHASIVEGLRRAHDIVAPHGVTMFLEIINTLAKVEPLNPNGDNHARYYLNHSAEAFEITRQVDGPFLKILFDLYHVQIMDGNLIETLRSNIANIGHFHVGDVPGRHEPGTGEIHHENVFRAIAETGFKGFVAMEYIPLGDAMQTLRDVRAVAMRAASGHLPGGAK